MLLETEMHRRDDLPMVAPRPLGPQAFVAAMLISMVVSGFAADVYFPLASGMEWVYECQTNVYKNCYRIRIASPGGEYREEFLEAPNVGSLKSGINRADGKWIMSLREFRKP